MASFAFLEHLGTTIAFNASADTLTFPQGYPAAGLVVADVEGGMRVSHGSQSLTLGGMAVANLDFWNLAFADGSSYFRGTSENDAHATGDGADQIDLSGGGDDSASAGAGNDLLIAGAGLSADDGFDGGTGDADELRIAGEYAAPVALNAWTVRGVERFVFGEGGTVRLQLHQNVFNTAEAHVTFDASGQGAGDGLWLDGAAVTSVVDAIGGAGGDTLVGGSANDTLAGGIGADSLDGGAGADLLYGGLDGDTLTGGAGSDRFVFAPGSPRSDASPASADRITDFGTGDRIDLPGTIGGAAVVFNTEALDFAYTGDDSGQQDFVNAHDGFVDAYWRNAGAGRLELWVDSDDDGLFSESDLLIQVDRTDGKTSLGYDDFVDNFVAWRGTAGNDSYVGNGVNNTAFALAGNDTLAGGVGTDTLYGGLGNDELAGDEGDEYLFGGTGADTLRGGAGNDTLYAVGQNSPSSAGADTALMGNTLDGGTGNDYLIGAIGNDLLDGGDDADYLSGDAGNDTLRGGLGDDNLSAGDGNDLLQGGGGADVLASGGADSRDTLEGGDGDDVLYGVGGRVTLTGGDGADRFAFTDAESDAGSWNYDMVYQAAGYSSVAAPGVVTDFDQAEGDLIRSGLRDGIATGGAAVVWRGAADARFTATVGESMTLAGSSVDPRFLEFWTLRQGDDTVLFMDSNNNGEVDSTDLMVVFKGDEGVVTLSAESFTAGTFSVKVGTNEADTITSPALTAAGDLVYAFAGNDSLDGLDGNDTVNGDAGDDVLRGGEGRDFLAGGSGADLLHGDAGNDYLAGGSGADTLHGGDGDDTLAAEGTEDWTGSTWVPEAGAGNVLHGGIGSDRLDGADGADLLHGDEGADQLAGAAGDDTLVGGDGDDTLSAGGGIDLLQGGSGRDSLHAADGGDLLQGGLDDDVLRGSSAYYTDAVVAADTLEGGAGNDVLYGYGPRVEMRGGEGADRFSFTVVQADDVFAESSANILMDRATTVGSTSLIVDFDRSEGDLLRTGIGSGTWNGAALRWRGAAAEGFTASEGQSIAEAGESIDQRFYEFWTAYDAAANQTVLFVDLDRDGWVGADDFKLAFTGPVELGAQDLTAGTFTVKIGTEAADTNADIAFTEGGDLVFGVGGNDTLDGLAGADTVNGDAGDDSLAGGDGNDVVYGGAGSDLLQGGADNDQLAGGSGSDTLHGGDGSDTLYAAGAPDSANLDEVADAPGTSNELYGGAGQDYLTGSDGDDRLYGEEGRDGLSGGGGDDTLLGGLDDDGLYGGDGADSLAGGMGNDNLDGGNGVDVVEGNEGNDTLTAGGDAIGDIDTLRGGDGDDLLVSLGSRAELWGEGGADVFSFGYGENDSIVGRGLATVAAPGHVADFDAAQGDRIRSGITNGLDASGRPVVWRGAAAEAFTGEMWQSLEAAGSDPADTRFAEFWTYQDGGRTVLFVDANRNTYVDDQDLKIVFEGAPVLTVDSFSEGTFNTRVGTGGDDTDTVPPLGAGADRAFGLGGHDTLDGLDGNDTLNGDAGNDHLVGNLGHDALHGGAGDDLLAGSGGSDWLQGGLGSDTLHGGDDGDTLYADGSEDSAESRSVDEPAGTFNALYGDGGRDYLSGAAGDDLLDGGADDDTLNGGAGNDTLAGADGADSLHGGDGTDWLQGGAGNDTLSTGGAQDVPGVDTLEGGEGDDVLYGLGEDVLMVGGDGADRFAFTRSNSDSGTPYSNLVFDAYASVGGVARIADFDAAEGDLIRTGIGGGSVSGTPVVWRGMANAAFLAADGQSLADAGADADDPRFFAFWTGFIPPAGEGEEGETFLFLDRNRDFIVDAGDLKILFAGAVNLDPSMFTGGTFAARSGTAAADTVVTLPPSDLGDWLLGLGGDDALAGGDGADTLAGNQGNDTLAGDAAADLLLGGTGADSLLGGEGADVLHGGSGNDTLDGGSGNDRLYAAGQGDAEYDPVADAEDAQNVLRGGIGSDTLEGDAGADQLFGGGDDDYIYGREGADTLYGEGNEDTLNGGDGDDLLFGGDGNDTLAGDAGDDTLDGGGGANALHGGDGSDTYVVRTADDSVQDYGWSGIDRVESHLADYTLGEDIEHGFIALAASARLEANQWGSHLEGNAGDDTLVGGEGHDTLDGGAGADTMAGGAGHDAYHLRGAEDTIVEEADGGIDTVISYLDVYQLAEHLENAMLGQGVVAGWLTGNDGDNSLSGGDGDDLLVGGEGNDTLYGGNGIDGLDGGAGDDLYWLESDYDHIVDASGTDTVVSAASWVLATGLENLSLSGTAAVDATGNEADNVILGNDGANVLRGMGGVDTLRGGNGDDTYHVDHADEEVKEWHAGAGVDKVVATVDWELGEFLEHLELAGSDDLDGTGNADANRIVGNAGANVLDGAAGSDTLQGGAGDDIYHVGTGDTVVEAVGEGSDTVHTKVDWILGDNVEHLVLDGPALAGTGNASANRIVGNGQWNVIDGGAGADMLEGGDGDDTYHVDQAGDEVVELAGEGWDEVVATASVTLDANVESLVLAGSAALNGTGNDGQNVLWGNAGANVLDGGAGIDTLWGGDGNDTYIVDHAGDLALEDWDADGVDTVRSSVSNYLHDRVENLTLTGTANLYAIGNTLANVLRGNDGANTLDGGSGSDTMYGGYGNDTYFVNSSGDRIEGESSTSRGGIDTVYASTSWSLAGDYVENLALTGYASINATGNSLANKLTGNDGKNILNGSTGADTMAGGKGNDTYYVDNAKDNVHGESSASSGGIDTVVASIDWSAAGRYVEYLTAASGTASIDLTGNTLANKLTGNSGKNILNGGSGADTMAGGKGSDIYHVDNARDSITGESSSSSGGIDSVFSSVSFSLAGDYVEQLALTGSSSINGTGNGLANVLTGNSGKNVLKGEGGKDTIDGGAGADTLTGGSSADRFVYDAASDSTLKALDRITDFTRGSDKIDLSHLDGNAGKSGHQDFSFIGSSAFSGNATGQLRFAVESGKVMLYGSTDADASAEFAVQVSGTTTLGGSDFVF
ncbi:MAG: M10 family metallopeptidase C-terminal domain-containing protein [Ramlibacter sp.]